MLTSHPLPTFIRPTLKHLFWLAQVLNNKRKEKLSPFFCWKEWGMMGPVVWIRWQFWKRRAFFCNSESLFYCCPSLRSINWQKKALELCVWQVTRWSKMQSVTRARASPGEAPKPRRDEAVFSAKGHQICVLRWRSSSGEASCLSLFRRMGTLVERRAQQQGWSESSRLSTLHVSETVHRASLALWADRPSAL